MPFAGPGSQEKTEVGTVVQQLVKQPGAAMDPNRWGAILQVGSALEAGNEGCAHGCLVSVCLSTFLGVCDLPLQRWRTCLMEEVSFSRCQSQLDFWSTCLVLCLQALA